MAISPPTKEQIAVHRPVLEHAIKSTQPDIIVPVGKLAIQEVLDQKTVALEETIGRTFSINPFGVLRNPIICIPLSHPSGRSSWNHTHKPLVNSALNHLKNQIES